MVKFYLHLKARKNFLIIFSGCILIFKLWWEEAVSSHMQWDIFSQRSLSEVALMRACYSNLGLRKKILAGSLPICLWKFEKRSARGKERQLRLRKKPSTLIHQSTSDVSVDSIRLDVQKQLCVLQQQLSSLSWIPNFKPFCSIVGRFQATGHFETCVPNDIQHYKVKCTTYILGLVLSSSKFQPALLYKHSFPRYFNFHLSNFYKFNLNLKNKKHKGKICVECYREHLL